MACLSGLIALPVPQMLTMCRGLGAENNAGIDYSNSAQITNNGQEMEFVVSSATVEASHYVNVEMGENAKIQLSGVKFSTFLGNLLFSFF